MSTPQYVYNITVHWHKANDAADPVNILTPQVSSVPGSMSASTFVFGPDQTSASSLNAGLALQVNGSAVPASTGLIKYSNGSFQASAPSTGVTILYFFVGYQLTTPVQDFHFDFYAWQNGRNASNLVLTNTWPDSAKLGWTVALGNREVSFTYSSPNNNVSPADMYLPWIEVQTNDTTAVNGVAMFNADVVFPQALFGWPSSFASVLPEVPVPPPIPPTPSTPPGRAPSAPPARAPASSPSAPVVRPCPPCKCPGLPAWAIVVIVVAAVALVLGLGLGLGIPARKKASLQ